MALIDDAVKVKGHGAFLLNGEKFSDDAGIPKEEAVKAGEIEKSALHRQEELAARMEISALEKAAGSTERGEVRKSDIAAVVAEIPSAASSSLKPHIAASSLTETFFEALFSMKTTEFLIRSYSGLAALSRMMLPR